MKAVPLCNSVLMKRVWYEYFSDLLRMIFWVLTQGFQHRFVGLLDKTFIRACLLDSLLAFIKSGPTGPFGVSENNALHSWLYGKSLGLCQQ